MLIYRWVNILLHRHSNVQLLHRIEDGVEFRICWTLTEEVHSLGTIRIGEAIDHELPDCCQPMRVVLYLYQLRIGEDIYYAMRRLHHSATSLYLESTLMLDFSHGMPD